MSVVEQLRKSRDFHRRMAEVYDNAYTQALEVAKEYGMLSSDVGVPEIHETIWEQEDSAQQEQEEEQGYSAQQEQEEEQGYSAQQDQDEEQQQEEQEGPKTERGLKTRLIREYFETHDIDTKPKQVIKDIQNDHGVYVSPSQVSAYKSKIKEESEEPEPEENNEDNDELEELVQDILEEFPDGLRLSEVVKEVNERGYHTNKSAQGLTNNVYQILRELDNVELDEGVYTLIPEE